MDWMPVGRPKFPLPGPVSSVQVTRHHADTPEIMRIVLNKRWHNPAPCVQPGRVLRRSRCQRSPEDRPAGKDAQKGPISSRAAL